MSLSALLSLWMNGWTTPGGFQTIALLFAAGGTLAFAPALLLARLAAAGRPRETRFAAAFLSLAATTLLATAFLYGLQHRLTFDEAHSPLLSLWWLLELGFVFAAAFYRFALFGVSLYFPLGLLFLFAASWWHARAAR